MAIDGYNRYVGKKIEAGEGDPVIFSTLNPRLQILTDDTAYVFAGSTFSTNDDDALADLRNPKHGINRLYWEGPPPESELEKDREYKKLVTRAKGTYESTD